MGYGSFYFALFTINMKTKKIHFYSAYLNRGGACGACDSLFNACLDNFDEFKISRSSFYMNGKVILKNEFLRLLGKGISIPTHQSQFYIPHSSVNRTSQTHEDALIHAHWINNIPINSIPTCKSLIITAHDQWLLNNGWAWDPNSLNSPTKQLEKRIEEISKIFRNYPTPIEYLRNNYPLKKVIAPSAWLKSYILHKTNLRNEEVQVIPNIINSSFFNYDQELYNKSKQGKSKLVIVASTAYWKEWRKGKDLLMKIFRRILNIYKKEVVFKIIGKIEVEKDLKNHCILYGNLSNKTQIAEVFNSAHCMVMTSRLENLTQTICEALFCGLPVITFDVGGNKEIISNKDFGDLVKYPNINDFIDSIIHFSKIDNEIDREKRSKAAKLKFSKSKIIKKHFSLYEKFS